MNEELSLAWQMSGHKGRPVILFLHGFLGNGQEWEEIVSYLAEDYRCLTVDLPGHGKSAGLNRHPDWGMENTAAALIALLNELAIKKCFVIGYSMGGRLALYLAFHYPRYFTKVILESASPGLITEEERRERIARDEQLAQRLETGDFREFLLEWYRQPLFQTLLQHPQFEGIFRNRLQNDPRALAKSLREMSTGRQPSLWEELSSNKIPLLLIVGGKDAKFRSIAAEMADICPAARVKPIESCGHNVHFENPIEFAKGIKSFLIV